MVLVGRKRGRRAMRRSGRLVVFVAVLTALVSSRPAPPADAAPTCSAGTPGSQPITLSDATESSGVATSLIGMMGHAIAWGDVNADGWQDVFVGTFADRPVAEYQFRNA